jgi:putative transferase (TIGR04331 family)
MGDEYFFIDTHLPRPAIQKLSKKMNRGTRYWDVPNTPEFKVDANMRNWSFHIKGKDGDLFLPVVEYFLPKLIPLVFIEGYKWLDDTSSTIRWPKNPKVIFTSNRHYSDVVFNAWTGDKRAAGSRLVIGEHGGHGIPRFIGSVNFQLRAADRFISTGWKNENYKNITPVGNFRQIGLKQEYDREGGIL